MRFHNPDFLWLLTLLIVPIIIHFVRFRKYKTIYFNNVEILKKLTSEKRKFSNLRRLIILLLRLCAITALVLVFANPYIPKKEDVADTDIVNIYIDNSASMESKTETITLLDNAKQKAKEIVNEYPNNMLFKVFSNNTPINPPVLNNTDANIAIDNIDISHKFKRASNVFNEIALSNKKNGSVNYFISDFQKSEFDYKEIPATDNQLTYFIPISNKNVNNLYIKDIELENPINIVNQENTIFATIENSSNSTIEKTPISLYINNSQVSTSTFTVDAKSSITIPLKFSNNTSGFNNGVVNIEDTTIEFDNNYYFSLMTKSNVNILNIYNNTPNVYLKSIYNTDSLFKVTYVNDKSIVYDKFTEFDIIVLDHLDYISSGLTDEVSRIIELGTTCVIFPGTDINLDEYNYLFSKLQIGKLENIMLSNYKNINIETSSSFFDNVFFGSGIHNNQNLDLPEFYKFYTLKSEATVNPLIDITETNQMLYAFVKYGSGNCFFSTSSLDENFTTLQNNVIFVPLMYKTLLTTALKNKNIYTPNDIAIPTNINNIPINELSLICNTTDVENKYTFNIINNITYLRFNDNFVIPAGNYSILHGNEVVDAFSINYLREESDMEFYDSETLNEILKTLDINQKVINADKDFSNTISKIVNDNNIWYISLILCILFLTIEMLLLRKWE